MLPLFSFLSYAKLIYLKAEIQKIQHGAQAQAWKISKRSTIPPWQSRGIKELWQNALHSWALPSCSSAAGWEPTRKGSEEATGETFIVRGDKTLGIVFTLQFSVIQRALSSQWCELNSFNPTWASHQTQAFRFSPAGQQWCSGAASQTETAGLLLDFHQQDTTSTVSSKQWGGFLSLPFLSLLWGQ